MFLGELKTPISHLAGVGPALQKKLAAAGLADIGSLLRWYPRSWEDQSACVPLEAWASARNVLVDLEVVDQQWFGFGRMKTLKLIVTDGSEVAALVCFNRPFLEKQYPPGSRVRVWAHFHRKYGEIQSTSFEIHGVVGSAPEGIVPVYPLRNGLGQHQLRRIMKEAIKAWGSNLEDEIPEAIRVERKLLHKAEALAAIHFPADFGELEAARTTLIYEELFHFEILAGQRVLKRRRESGLLPAGGMSTIGGTAAAGSDPTGAAGESSAQGENPISPLQQRLIERLPFTLTPGQMNALADMNRDIASGRAMARLLQGDVGSGKTLVAFLAALACIELGLQVAILAPTELLARQHAAQAGRVLDPLGLRLASLSGSVKASSRKHLLAALKAGEIDLIVGTHALFSKDVEYHKLGLVVVDEQHRFGVLQRAAIMAKGANPHLLMMSATPIPRSLALTLFGDLDVSTIRELPAGRKPIRTHLARHGNEEKVYEFVRRELEAGRQAYFVYPLIEGEEGMALKDAVGMAGELEERVFPGWPLALVHSKVDDEEKAAAMEGFRRGDIRILVATSVVEVGIDVPNASCMVIEHAERFGLAALHQLRGRVGRGEAQSYCFLVYSKEPGEDGAARLKVMKEHNDGFIIAEEDLKLRGPGQLSGLEQSGYLALGIADPVRDIALLGLAREDAFALLEGDPGLLEADNQRVALLHERAPPFRSGSL